MKLLCSKIGDINFDILKDGGQKVTWRNYVDKALKEAYLAGFLASGEGYNAEYPFQDYSQNPEEDKWWCKNRDNALDRLKLGMTDEEFKNDKYA